MADYAKKDKRIRIITQENQGLSGARNSGMAIMTGDYFSFIDSDDWLQLGAYQKFIEVLQKEEQVIDIFVFNGFQYLWDKYLTAPTFTKIFNIQEWGNFSKTHFKNIRHHLNPTRYPMQAWGKLFRTDWYRKYNFQFMDRMQAQDHLFSAQTYLATDNVYVLEDYLYCYRKHTEAISQNRNENIFHLLIICDKVKEVYKQNNCFDEHKYAYLEYLVREAMVGVRTCRDDLLDAYLREARRLLKLLIPELDVERYKTDISYERSQDILHLSGEELRKKYGSR